MNWDAEVDVVCIEAGLGGLASAIATVDGGFDVFVASSTAVDGACLVKVGPRADRLSNWLDIDVTDTQTLEYFAALCPASGWTGAPGMSIWPLASSPSPRRSRAVAR